MMPMDPAWANIILIEVCGILAGENEVDYKIANLGYTPYH